MDLVASAFFTNSAWRRNEYVGLCHLPDFGLRLGRNGLGSCNEGGGRYGRCRKRTEDLTNKA